MDDSQALAEVRLLWRDYRPTPLIELPELARLADVGRVFVKDESARPLGNFKALGGLVAGIRALSRATGIGFCYAPAMETTVWPSPWPRSGPGRPPPSIYRPASAGSACSASRRPAPPW
jgi:hypothetical protein